MPADDFASTDRGSTSGTRDWLFEARTALDARDHQHAIYAAREALTLNGSSAEAWSIRSQASFALEHYQDAAFEAREAVRLAPQLAEHHLALGSALEVLTQYDEALREFEEAVRLDPSDLQARSSIGSVYIGMEQPADAIVVFERLRSDGFDHELVRAMLARALYDDAMQHVTNVPGGQYALATPGQVTIASDRADRGLALDFEDREDIRSSLWELQTLAQRMDQSSWRHTKHPFVYLITLFLAATFSLSVISGWPGIVVGLLAMAVLAGTIYGYIRRHHKPNWQWAGEDARRAR